MYLMGMMSLLGQASDLPKHPELHAAINAHLLTEKEKYFGRSPLGQCLHRSTVGRFIRRDLKKQGASWPPQTDREAVETTFTFFHPV